MEEDELDAARVETAARGRREVFNDRTALDKTGI
jgi:hypothetical protein